MTSQAGGRLLNFVKSTIIGGLFVLVPIVLLLVIVGKAVEVVYSAIQPLFEWSPVKSATGITIAIVIGVSAIIFICFLAGLLARTTLARRFVGWIESMLLSQLPGYSLMKGVGEGLVGAEGRDGRAPVLAHFDDSSMLGFLMDRLTDGRVVVFIPSAPNPMTGMIHVMEANRVMPLSVPISGALDCLKRLGVDSAHLLCSPRAPGEERSPRGA